jgi:hypothetical protein
MRILFSTLFACSFFLACQGQSENNGFGKHLITASPFVGYVTPEISDLGVGLGYEYFLNEYISAKIPLNVGLRTSLFQTGVGLKVYPFGHDRPLKYALGPTFLFTHSSDGFEVPKYDTVNMFFFNKEVDNPLTQVGFILTNSLNLTVQKHIYIGAEMGLGLNYVNNYRDNITSGTRIVGREEPNVLFMFTLAMGYRF